MPSYFVPLRHLFPDNLIPVDVLTWSEGPALVDRFGISDYRVERTEAGLYFRADLALDPYGEGDPSLVASLPQFPDLGLVLSHLGRLEVWFQPELSLRISMGAFAIRLPSGVLQPVHRGAGGAWEADPGREYVEITIDYASFTDELPVDAREHPIVFSVDGQGRIGIEYPFKHADGEMIVPIVSLNGPAMVGESGVVLEAKNVAFNFSPDNPMLLFGEAFLRLPSDLLGATPLPDIRFENASLSRHGFSGSVTASWPLAYQNDTFVYQIDGSVYDAELFALQGGLRHLSLSFQENRIIASDIAGGLLIPYFDEPVDIQLAFAGSHDLVVTLQGMGEEGIVLTKEELIALNIQSLAVSRQGDLASIVVSGGLEPLLMAADGLEWPRLDVKELSIEQDITDLTKLPVLRFTEAWLDLKDLATLDLWGFYFELNRVGLGYEEARDRLWVDLTGSIRLIEQIPVGLGVEGFRLSWPRTLYEMLDIQQLPTLQDALAIASQLEVKFDGIYLFYGVPQAVEFEGYIRFIKEAQKIGFAGDMVLRVPASGFSLEAGLMVGMNFAQPMPYPFLYVYCGVELPSGIPLGQSGLALKGALGLFGLNVVPDKTPEQNWYYDWYKRGPFQGAHQTNKWRDEFLAVALGIGLTITTTDGYIKGVRGLLVLAIPGPILIIEGRSLILDGLLPGEPPLRAMAVFDGRERVVQFNIEAEAELIEDMLDAYGMLEAFFDFKDLTNWHLYLGQDEPRDRRIQANILKFKDVFLFKADAYLMIDMIGSHTLRARMGVFVGFKPPIPPLGPVQITLDAVLEGDGVVTVLPEQFSGGLNLSANITLQAFGFGLQMVAGAGVLTEGPRPLKVDAEVFIKAELPLPLAPVQDFLPDFAQDAIPDIPPLEVEASLEFSWQSPDPPEIVPPLVSVTADSPFVPGGGALEIRDRIAVSAPPVWHAAAESSPVVPIDTRPVLAFTHEMNDTAHGPGPAFTRHPDGAPKAFNAGLLRFTPTLTAVRLYEHRKGEPWPDTLDGWKLVAASPAADLTGETARLPGVWMTEADPQGPGQPATRRLQLWTQNPLLHAGKALGSGYAPMGALAYAATDSLPSQSHAEALLDLYPTLHVCGHSEPQRVCVAFDTPAPTPEKPGGSWAYRDLQFTHHHDARAAFGDTGTSAPPAQPRLSRQAWMTLARDLAVSDALFARLRAPASPARLERWAGSVSAAQRRKIRRQLPRWSVVWDWLWPSARPSPICLHLSGTMHTLRFPQPVRRVWIRFCRAPGVHPNDVAGRLEVHRTAHDLDGLMEILTEARAKGRTPDFSACREQGAHQVEIDGDTWVISSTTGFDCLTLLRLAEFAIAEICYLTEEEVLRAAQAEEQCETNDALLDEGALLHPGSYYRLEVDTSLAGTLIPPGVLDARMVTLLKQLFEPILETLGLDNGNQQVYHHVAFFQTEGPPTQLARYIKWSSPERQAVRVFREDDFLIRFLRSNVGAMYAHPPHELQVWIRSAEGRLIDGYTTAWDNAGSASLLHEEQVWGEHIGTAGSLPNDDVLIARRANAHLEPNARYELLVTGGEGGELLPLVWATVGETGDGWSQAEGVFMRSAAAADSWLAGDPTWQDIDVSVELKGDAGEALGVLIRADSTPENTNGFRARRAYRLVLRPGGQHALELLSQPAQGALPAAVPLAQGQAVTLQPGQWARVRLSIIGDRLRAWLFDQPLLDVRLSQLRLPARGGLVPTLPVGSGLAGLVTPALPGRSGRRTARPQPSASAGGEFHTPIPQGQVGLYAASAGARFRQPRVRSAILHASGFTTSAFESMARLIGSFEGSATTVTLTHALPAEFTSGAPSTSGALASRLWQWHRDQVDYRFEALAGGREALEASRLALRQARADHDAAFRALAPSVGTLFYQPFAPRLEVYLLQAPDGDTQSIVGIWIRSPESLDLRMDVAPATGGDGISVGRTTLGVARDGSALPFRLFHDADSTQLLLLPQSGAEWAPGPYDLTFTYRRNHEDEASARDHRYDRSVEQRSGDAAPLVATITFLSQMYNFTSLD